MAHNGRMTEPASHDGPGTGTGTPTDPRLAADWTRRLEAVTDDIRALLSAVAAEGGPIRIPPGAASARSLPK